MSHQITAPTILLNFFVCKLAKKIISKVCAVFWAERVESEAVSQSWTALDLVGITTITYSLCSEKGLFFSLLDKNSIICILRILGSQPLPIHFVQRKTFSFRFWIRIPLSDLIFVKKFTRPDFQAKKIYSLKVRKFWLFLLEKKLRKCIYITYFSSFFVRN